MKREQARHSIDFLFVLLIFVGFLGTAIMLVTLGTNEYHRIVDGMQVNDGVRIAAAYLTQKVHQMKGTEAITVGELEGNSALMLRQRIGNRDYITYLYVYDGQLRELMTAESNDSLRPVSGTEILPMQQLTFEDTGRGAVLVRSEDAEGREEKYLLAIEP